MDIFAGICCNNMDTTCVFPLVPIFLLEEKCLQFILLSMFIPQVWRLKVILGVGAESNTELIPRFITQYCLVNGDYFI